MFGCLNVELSSCFLLFKQNLLFSSWQQLERPPMFRCIAMKPNCRPVFGSWVAFIALPAVLWVFYRQGIHVFVTESFCQNRSSGDAQVAPVALYHAMMRYARIRSEPVPVYQERGRLGSQFRNGPMHPFHRCPKDVQPVNFCGFEPHDRPGNCRAFDDGPQ